MGDRENTVVAPPESGSVLRGAGSLVEKVNQARLELLDLSTRNRLLHTPRSGRAKTVEVVGELAKAMYQTLVIEGKRFTFVAGREEAKAGEEIFLSDGDADLDDLLLAELPEDPELLAQPDLELDEKGRVVSQWDAHLTTRLTPTGLQKRLVDLYIDARTLQEEQGINVLYLAIGYLKWRAPSAPKIDRYAPLVLVPVSLERSNAGEKFHLRWQGDDIQANLSLQLFLKREFELPLPDIKDFESLDIDAYLAEIASLIDGKPDWAVVPNDAVLGLFSFAKFMMYRDLDPAVWEPGGGLGAIPMLRGVVSGFAGVPVPDKEVEIDEAISPERMRHVVDSDSSQSMVVHDTLAGHSLVVQGPPGTGKSQTIANIIAGAVAAGQRVLFVAEKLAALEVVKRRLDSVKIGNACLELHSNKANKRALLEELRLTWQLSPLPNDTGTALLQQLIEKRDALNAHAARLHRPLLPAELTPYQVFGGLVRLRREGYLTERLALDGALQWAPHEVKARRDLAVDIGERIAVMGTPSQHAWSGVGNDALLPNERARLVGDVADLANALVEWQVAAAGLHQDLGLASPDRLGGCASAIAVCDTLLTAPPIGGSALASAVWDDAAEVEDVLARLALAQALRGETATLACEGARDHDWTDAEESLAALPAGFKVSGELCALATAHCELGALLPELARLAQLLSERGELTFATAARIFAIAERATTIPELDRDALVARIWERGVDTVESVVDSVERVQSTRKELASVFRESAWSKNLEDARSQLASRSGSWLRFLSGEWRAASRLVRSQLSNPKLPADQMLASLDLLLDGQAAQRRVQEADAQGLEAFGSSWERDRSNASNMREVVAWMRTLRPLGAGVREQLADIGDRRLATELATRLRPRMEALQTQLLPVHEALLAAGVKLWGDETALPSVPLEVIHANTARYAAAMDDALHLTGLDELSIGGALGQIEKLREEQSARQRLLDVSASGEAAFGALWHGAESQTESLRAALAWMHAHAELRHLAATLPDAAASRREAADRLREGDALALRLTDLFTTLEFSGTAALDRDTERASVSAAIGQLRAWEADPEGLPQWVAYLAQTNLASKQGMSAFVDALASGQLPHDRARGAFDLAYLEVVLAAMVARDRALGQFDGKRQSELVEAFAQFDRDRIELARHQVAQAHRANIPQRGGAAGPTAVLMGEMAKKKGHFPIRQLMERAAPAIQALKPVFMMSPLSVAQFLPPGSVEFDLLVIDEASQVQPIDALGAIARAKQIVVVGDERQLPPTRFFFQGPWRWRRNTDGRCRRGGPGREHSWTMSRAWLARADAAMALPQPPPVLDCGV